MAYPFDRARPRAGTPRRSHAGRMIMRPIPRRDFAALTAAAMTIQPACAQSSENMTRAIPRTGESPPAFGFGTAAVFDRDNEQTRAAATAVLRMLIESGGRLVDTASTYGDAESVLGVAMASEALRAKIFIATKLEAPDAAELKRSLARLTTGT